MVWHGSKNHVNYIIWMTHCFLVFFLFHYINVFIVTHDLAVIYLRLIDLLISCYFCYLCPCECVHDSYGNEMKTITQCQVKLNDCNRQMLLVFYFLISNKVRSFTHHLAKQIWEVLLQTSWSSIQHMWLKIIVHVTYAIMPVYEYSWDLAIFYQSERKWIFLVIYLRLMF